MELAEVGLETKVAVSKDGEDTRLIQWDKAFVAGRCGDLRYFWFERSLIGRKLPLMARFAGWSIPSLGHRLPPKLSQGGTPSESKASALVRPSKAEALDSKALSTCVCLRSFAAPSLPGAQTRTGAPRITQDAPVRSPPTLVPIACSADAHAVDGGRQVGHRDLDHQVLRVRLLAD